MRALLCTLGLTLFATPVLADPQEASESTRNYQKSVVDSLPFADRQSFADARRGLIAPLPDNGYIAGPQNRPAWDLSAYEFLNAEAPDTVNPSLWRQSQLVMQNGLFQVTDRLYQVRSADLSNMTIIEGDSGIIVVDPLVSRETAKAALDLYYSQRGQRPVVAVIYSHSHIDHFGGVRGVVDEADVTAGRVRILAPAGFMQAATEENLMAGNAMSRRAAYMYGNLLPPSPKGHVGAGLGLMVSRGTPGLIAPTEIITQTGQTLTIDGLTFEFLLAPGTEAPAEMHWYIPELNALTAAENCSQTLHNVYTLRGAKTRDARAWSRYIDETLVRWGGKAKVLYGMHHWPVWGNDRIVTEMSMARDAYKFIHDQTLHFANQGLNKEEIAETLTMPPSLNNRWGLRGYYGTLSHNVKGTFTFTLGWFDGNPANLHPLPPRQQAQKTIAYMGGPDAVVKKAKKDFEHGNYRWVASILNDVVHAAPEHKVARALLADTYEQLGYQSEAGPWRNFYLTGAMELRQNKVTAPMSKGSGNADMMRAIDLDAVMDYLGIRLNAQRAEGKTIRINMSSPGSDAVHSLWLQNSVLNFRKNHPLETADVTIIAPEKMLPALFMGIIDPTAKQVEGKVQITGNPAAFKELLSYLDNFSPDFSLTGPFPASAADKPTAR